MKINLEDNWENTDVKLNYKSYSVSVNKRDIINEIFDKIYEQDKMEWI